MNKNTKPKTPRMPKLHLDAWERKQITELISEKCKEIIDWLNDTQKGAK